MSKDTAQILLGLFFALTILGVDAWASYHLGVKRQERLQAWFGAGSLQKRKSLRWGLFICGATSLAIALLGYWMAAPAVIGIGLYLFATVAVHRAAYVWGKKSATDPDH